MVALDVLMKILHLVFSSSNNIEILAWTLQRTDRWTNADNHEAAMLP